MQLPEDSTTQTALVAVVAGVLGFVLRNAGAIYEGAKVVFRGLKTIFGVMYRFRQAEIKVEELTTRVERLEKLLLMLLEQLDIDPNQADVEAETVADLAPHEQELIFAWRKMREVPNDDG